MEFWVSKMRKIAFVVPWYGNSITGGAEMETRDLANHLREAGVEIEVLTTCVESFSSDWNKEYHKPGVTTEAGVVVKRFRSDKRDAKAFDAVNYKLMQGEAISREEQLIFVDNAVNSQDLYAYMRENQDDYTAFLFIPYMFGTTYYGCQVNLKKSVLIPCFHEESYFHMDIFRETFSKVAGIVYNAAPEMELVHSNYELEDYVREIVMGIGMDTNVHGQADRFREKYSVKDDFILYAGRKDAGKNVDILIRYFAEYRKRNKENIKLILIGGGNIEIPTSEKDSIIDLGFVDKQDKYDACAAALCLCQPSTHESFSYVIMESWLCGRPVLVHEGCEVTKDFAIRSQGGLYFKDYFEFEGCINYYRDNPYVANSMGENGRQFVKDSFDWNVIVSKYSNFLDEIE